MLLQGQHNFRCENARLVLAVYVTVILFCKLINTAKTKAVLAKLRGNQLTQAAALFLFG